MRPAQEFSYDIPIARRVEPWKRARVQKRLPVASDTGSDVSSAALREPNDGIATGVTRLARDQPSKAGARNVRLGQTAVGVVLGIIIVPLAFYVYCKSGKAPAAAADPPLPMEKAFAKAALRAAIDSQAPKTVPIEVDENNLEAGARIYRENCAVCHGLPVENAPAMATLMFPKA